MTSKADLTEEEWDLVLEGPAAAGLLVSTAERDGTIRSIPVDVSRAPPDWKAFIGRNRQKADIGRVLEWSLFPRCGEKAAC